MRGICEQQRELSKFALTDAPGFNQSKKGAIYRDVCSADITLVEPMKITPSQISNGSQYLRKDFIQRSDVRDEHGSAEHPSSNTERPMAERDSGIAVLN
jgi:hypothetical protein